MKLLFPAQNFKTNSNDKWRNQFSNTLPILDNILFEISDNHLTISASDLETTMSTSLKVESDENGSLAIPAKHF